MTGQIRSVVRDFWQFYRRYTNTAVHTASAAALAIFGLLVFLDPWFVLLAIAAYVVPPIVLFLRRGTEPVDGSGAATNSAQSRPSSTQFGSGESAGSRTRRTGGRDVRDGTTGPVAEDGDTDSDGDDGDTDSDADDGDTDTDSDSDS